MAASNLDALIGVPVMWSASGGTISSAQAMIQSNGTATATFTPTAASPPNRTATAQVDNGAATVNFTVGKADTTTMITSDNPDPSNVGQQVTVQWSFSVNSPGSGTPTGNMVVTVNDMSGNTCMAAATAGSCNLTLTTAGMKTLTATYAGDANYNGSSDTETHQVNNNLDISARDGRAPEPASGTAPLIFTVALSAPSAGGVMVNYATANGGATPATGGANCSTSGVDYETTSGTLTFAAGEQLKTVAVNLCSDAVTDDNETFLLNLSMAVNGNIIDNQAVGTITANTPGTVLITELRTSGPGGLGDDFVEIFNNTSSPLTVAASDASAGFGLYKMGADCNATPVLIGVIPNGTVIPSRGHYLLVGSAYSLTNYGGTGAAAGNLTFSSDIESDRNVALFTTSNPVNLSTVNRLDAVGFGTNTGAVCDLLREGTTLANTSGATSQYSYVRDQCGKGGSTTAFGACATGGAEQDTNANAVDFFAVSTTPSTPVGMATLRLGAPGPENLASPLRRDLAVIPVTLIDPMVAPSASPNRVRDLTSDPPNNSTFGTLSIRRTVTNNTGGNVTRLRFRIVDISTFGPQPGGVADLRGRTSGTVMATVTGGGMVMVQGTTLEQPPAQPNGGGMNSTLSVGTITLGTPLANGASINVQFLLGVQQTGSFKFYINLEALP